MYKLHCMNMGGLTASCAGAMMKPVMSERGGCHTLYGSRQHTAWPSRVLNKVPFNMRDCCRLLYYTAS